MVGCQHRLDHDAVDFLGDICDGAQPSDHRHQSRSISRPVQGLASRSYSPACVEEEPAGGEDDVTRTF